MGSVFFVVGPVRGENLVGPAAEQEVEFLLEDAVDLFAARLIEIGHRPAAELEARISLTSWRAVRPDRLARRFVCGHGRRRAQWYLCAAWLSTLARTPDW